MVTGKKVLKILGIAVIIFIIALILFIIAINFIPFGDGIHEENMLKNPGSVAAGIVKQAYADPSEVFSTGAAFKQDHSTITLTDIINIVHSLEPNQIQFIPSKVQMSDFIVSSDQIKYTGTKTYKVTLYAMCSNDGEIPNNPYYSFFDSTYAITGSKDTVCYLTLAPYK